MGGRVPSRETHRAKDKEGANSRLVDCTVLDGKEVLRMEIIRSVYLIG